MQIMLNRHSKGRAAGRRSRKSSEYSAERLMRAALDLFSRHDFSSVTIKDIAKASDMNTALIYYYYDSKEDLFRAAIEFAIKTALERSYELCDKHADPVYLIKEWFRSNHEFANLIRQLVKIMLDYAGSGHSLPSVDTLVKEFYTVEQSAILANGIRRGIAKGIFRDVNPTSIARFVSVHLDGIMVASIIRSKFNIEKALFDLQNVLWYYLGYDDGQSAPKRRSRVSKAGRPSPSA
jgi:AcrR family transcriptional regulator